MSKVKREGESGRTAWLLIFITVSVFCIVFFAARGRFQTPFSSPAVITLLAPFQRAASWAGDQVQGLVANVWDILTVHQQNQMLRSEVEQLRVQNVKANEYVAENIRLRELLGYTQSATQFDLTMARVIGREPSTWTRMIVIDRGTQHGVRKNMPVVTARGLVGTVTEAGPISSKVQLILDPRAAAGALVQRSRVAGVVKGTPDDAMHPRLINVPKNQDMAVGDIVVTSGFGGIYPKGIMIGTVANVKNDSSGLLHYAVIEPAADFQRLEDVAVITASREAPPEPLQPPVQTPGTETDPKAVLAAQEEAARRAAQPPAPAAPAQTANQSPATVNPKTSPTAQPAQTPPTTPPPQTGAAAQPAAPAPARQPVQPQTQSTGASQNAAGAKQ
ncbi:MAG: rod shape-determining protein MreC [Schwartzia sp.]|nr:rod shape-determining protein MreC [Schwartzia sp. (in: firmicutes)]